MSGRFVRASKYRHVFGQTSKREACYDNLRISKNAWDTNIVKCNPKYVSVNWEASGGGAFAVIPLEERGKLPDVMPLFRGHTAAVLDHDWNPFNDDILASASDDGKVCLWRVPDNFSVRTDAEEPEDVMPVGKLSGHGRKVGHVLFNPAAENILASSSGDYTVKLWDLEDGQPRLTLKHNDMVQSLSWSADGNMLCTTSRDKKLRFWDVRQEKPAHEVAGHSGAKSSRVVWLGDHDRVATTGFSKMSDRQLGLWDPRNPSKPIGGDFTYLDSQSGICMPFWDDGSQMLYLAGKGDGNIRYFEYDNDKFEPLSEHKSPEPQRGLAFMPKRGVNTHANEVMRAYKTVNDQYIEPISFVVPRRAEMFQDDIYPPATGSKPAMSSAEWLDGKSARPAKIDMGDMYDGTAPKEYAAADAPTVAPAKTMAAPTPAPVAVEPRAEEQPQPAAAPREIPSMKDNQQSMSDMANKFAAKDAEESSDEEPSSPFEEIQKPTQRPTSIIAARQEEKVGVRTPPMQQQQERSLPTPTASAPAPEPSRVPSANAAPSSQSTNDSPAASSSAPITEQPSAEPTSSITRSASSAAGGLKEVLGEIRGLLQAQGRQIEALTNEVAELKMKLR